MHLLILARLIALRTQASSARAQHHAAHCHKSTRTPCRSKASRCAKLVTGGSEPCHHHLVGVSSVSPPALAGQS
eukprot:1808298-Alexandrium_andersonii.AAC.1